MTVTDTPRADIDELGQLLTRLPENDRGFANSLLRQSRTKTLSDKQMYWVRTLIERAKSPPQPKPRVNVGDMAGVIDLFERAKAKLKHPAVVLASHDTPEPIRLTIASDRARFPGSVNVTTEGRFTEREWLGRIRLDGSFEPSRKLAGNPLVNVSVALLKRFAADPVTVATEHGRMTGHCSFCARRLTDDRSVDVGYGPQCAKNFGLPWGR